MKKVLRYSLEEKASVLDNGFYKAYKRARFEDYKGDGSLINEFHRLCDCDSSFNRDFKICKAIEGSLKRKRKRVFQKENQLAFSSGGKIAFVTFTFSDETLKRTSDDTRRQKVRRTLKKVSSVYIANIDFGKERDREHYHALLSYDGFESVRALEKAVKALWGEYGFIKVKRVGNKETDKKRLGKYLLKLGLHSMKDTTKAHRLIYSRNVIG